MLGVILVRRLDSYLTLILTAPIDEDREEMIVDLEGFLGSIDEGLVGRDIALASKARLRFMTETNLDPMAEEEGASGGHGTLKPTIAPDDEEGRDALL
jgi:hypothetical protein